MIQINLSSSHKPEEHFVKLLGVLKDPSLKDVVTNHKSKDGTQSYKQLKVLREMS